MTSLTNYDTSPIRATLEALKEWNSQIKMMRLRNIGFYECNVKHFFSLKMAYYRYLQRTAMWNRPTAVPTELVASHLNRNILSYSYSISIDMRIVSRPPPPLHFPLCAECVPFELVVSAALL
jgi:hypothetical protein